MTHGVTPFPLEQPEVDADHLPRHAPLYLRVQLGTFLVPQPQCGTFSGTFSKVMFISPNVFACRFDNNVF